MFGKDGDVLYQSAGVQESSLMSLYWVLYLVGG